MPEGKHTSLKEAIQKDGQRHLYVKSAITSGTTQYIHMCIEIEIQVCIFQDKSILNLINVTEKNFHYI